MPVDKRVAIWYNNNSERDECVAQRQSEHVAGD